MRENLWVHTLGPLNMPILSEAIIEVSGPEFDTKPYKQLLIGSTCSKDLMCVPRGSLAFRLFASHSFMSEKTSGFQGTTLTLLELFKILLENILVLQFELVCF